MNQVSVPYSRADALRDGVLIDVSELAEGLGIPFPVAVSASLFNHPAFDARFRKLHLEFILRVGLTRAHWLSGEHAGEVEPYSVLCDNAEWADTAAVRGIVERLPDGVGLVATLFEAGERCDLLSLAATFYEN
jgi:hypothetical protein